MHVCVYVCVWVFCSLEILSRICKWLEEFFRCVLVFPETFFRSSPVGRNALFIDYHEWLQKRRASFSGFSLFLGPRLSHARGVLRLRVLQMMNVGCV